MTFDRRPGALAGLAVAVSLLAGGPVWAHHSLAMYDINKTLALSGTVKDVQWANPHVTLTLVVQEERGTSAWLIEAPSPISLKRWNWAKDFVKPGDRAQITIHPMRDGSLAGVALSAQANGVKVTPPA